MHWLLEHERNIDCWSTNKKINAQAIISPWKDNCDKKINASCLLGIVYQYANAQTQSAGSHKQCSNY